MLSFPLTGGPQCCRHGGPTTPFPRSLSQLPLLFPGMLCSKWSCKFQEVRSGYPPGIHLGSEGELQLLQGGTLCGQRGQELRQAQGLWPNWEGAQQVEGVCEVGPWNMPLLRVPAGRGRALHLPPTPPSTPSADASPGPGAPDPSPPASSTAPTHLPPSLATTLSPRSFIRESGKYGKGTEVSPWPPPLWSQSSLPT